MGPHSVMSAREPQKNSRLLSRRGVPFLLLLVALAFLATSPQLVIHIHHSETAGIYDEDCPLVDLSASHGQTTLPAAPPSVRIGAITGIVLLLAIGDCSAPIAVYADPRAPPLS